MVRQQVSAALLTALLALVWLVAPTMAQDQYTERTMDIARGLECPVCEGQSVAESGSGLARQMRDIIEQKVNAGESDAQIRQYFVDRYGEVILRDPPKSGFALALWWGPVIAVVFGALVVGLYLSQRTRRIPPPARAVEMDDELEAIAREVLATDAPQAERTLSS